MCEVIFVNSRLVVLSIQGRLVITLISWEQERLRSMEPWVRFLCRTKSAIECFLSFLSGSLSMIVFPPVFDHRIIWVFSVEIGRIDGDISSQKHMLHIISHITHIAKSFTPEIFLSNLCNDCPTNIVDPLLQQYMTIT